ncbi:uncharacterized, partial [Tachysurus ichikawai]
ELFSLLMQFAETQLRDAAQRRSSETQLRIAAHGPA